MGSGVCGLSAGGAPLPRPASLPRGSLAPSAVAPSGRRPEPPQPLPAAPGPVSARLRLRLGGGGEDRGRGLRGTSGSRGTGLRTSPGAYSPCAPALCARPRPASPEPGPRLCAGSGPPPEHPPRGVRTAPLRLDCLPPRSGTGCAPSGFAASRAPAEARGDGQRSAACALSRALASGTPGRPGRAAGCRLLSLTAVPPPCSRRAVGRGVRTRPRRPGPARPPQLW